MFSRFSLGARSVPFLFLFALGFTLSGCNWYFAPQEQYVRPNEVVFSEDAPLDFAVIQQNAMNTCLHCHSGQNQPTLMSYNDVHQNLQKVMDEVEQNQMPPAKAGFTPLSDCEKDLLRTWIKEGAPQLTATKVGHLSSCDHFIPPPPIDTTPISQLPLTYDSVEKRLFIPKCILCHNASNTDSNASHTLLSPFRALMAAQVVGATADESKL